MSPYQNTRLQARKELAAIAYKNRAQPLRHKIIDELTTAYVNRRRYQHLPHDTASYIFFHKRTFWSKAGNEYYLRLPVFLPKFVQPPHTDSHPLFAYPYFEVYADYPSYATFTGQRVLEWIDGWEVDQYLQGLPVD